MYEENQAEINFGLKDSVRLRLISGVNFIFNLRSTDDWLWICTRKDRGIKRVTKKSMN